MCCINKTLLIISKDLLIVVAQFAIVGNEFSLLIRICNRVLVLVRTLFFPTYFFPDDKNENLKKKMFSFSECLQTMTREITFNG